MTAASSTLGDPYTILDVGPSASLEEIRAGFLSKLRSLRIEREGLALRRLQAAYSILQHDSTRSELPGLAALPDPTQRESVRVALGALATGDWLRAQINLQQAVELGVRQILVRYLLGLALLYGDRGPDGIRELDAAREAAPEHPGLWLHRAEATLALGAPKDALPLFEYALSLDPDSPLARLGLSQCHGRLGSAAVALAALDGVDEDPGAAKPSDSSELSELALHTTLLRIERIAGARSADHIPGLLKKLREGLRASPDKQRYATERLATVLEGAVVDIEDLDAGTGSYAGWLLKQVQELPWVRSQPLSSIPKARVATLAELPEEVRERLAHLPQDPPVYFAARPLAAGSMWLLSSLCLMLSLPILLLLGQGALPGFKARELLLLESLFFLPLFGGIALALRGLRITQARVGSYHAIYSFFLVHAHLDEVVMMPLCHLRQVQVTDVFVNGTYRYTTVESRFGGAFMSFSVEGESEARVFSKGLLWARTRALVRCLLGLLPAEEGYAALQPSSGSAPAPSPALRWARRYAPAAALAVLLIAAHYVYSRWPL